MSNNLNLSHISFCVIIANEPYWWLEFTYQWLYVYIYIYVWLMSFILALVGGFLWCLLFCEISSFDYRLWFIENKKSWDCSFLWWFMFYKEKHNIFCQSCITYSLIILDNCHEWCEWYLIFYSYNHYSPAINAWYLWLSTY